jgi:hypothetical protein
MFISKIWLWSHQKGSTGVATNAFYPHHATTKKCKVGAEQRRQQEAAVTSAFGLRQECSIHGDLLERVEVFKYLGCLLAQDDDDIRAICAQLQKARATWA